MKMRNILFLSSVFFFLSICTFGQNVRVIERNSDYHKQEKVNTFEFIDKGVDINKFEKIAILEGYTVNSGKLTLISLFNSFWDHANNLGANSFIINSLKTNVDTIFIQVALFFLDEQAMKANFDLYPKNMVYVFGDIDKKKGSEKNIKLNKQKLELSPMEYVACQNRIGEYVSVSIGGFLGAKTEIFGKEGRLPQFLSLSGFGVGPGNSYNSISFNTGRIYPVELNFGQFLIKILTRKRILPDN